MTVRRVTAVLGLWVALSTAGCSVDPTDPSNYNSVNVRNDTASQVVLVQCDTSCGVLHDRTTLAAGESTVVSVSNEDITVGYAVQTPGGKTLGCLYFRYNGPLQNLKANISAIVRC